MKTSKRAFAIIIAFIFLFASLFLFVHRVSADVNTNQSFITEAVVLQTSKNATNETRNTYVKIIEGKLMNREVTIVDSSNLSPNHIVYKPGDHVIITYSADTSGEHFYITDYDRKPAILALFFLFLIFIFIVGR